ncbi:unnamed protein product [Amoebophrya sp. A25]|nr:unnamed protein product [Amoebophrya sp. A25]|eukprot:GSA25T00003166001.1
MRFFLALLACVMPLFLAQEVREAATVEQVPLEVGKMPPTELLNAPASAVAAAAVVAPKTTLAAYTLLPTPTPNVLAAFFALLLWITIFLMGFCALFGIDVLFFSRDVSKQRAVVLSLSYLLPLGCILRILIIQQV